MASYSKGGGMVLPGLVCRRAAEQALFNSPADEPDEREEEEDMQRYNTVAKCPSWAQDTVRKLYKKGYLSSSNSGSSRRILGACLWI